MHTLNSDQQKIKDAIQPMQGGDRLIVSGRAGSGKTYAIANSVAERKALFLTPTHPACAVLEQELTDKRHSITTIHKAIGAKKQRDENLNDIDCYRPAKEARRRLVQAGDDKISLFGDVDIIVVDEFSMVGSFLFGAIEEYAIEFDLPVVYNGDRFQLPPVNDHEVIVNQGFKTITLDSSMRFPKDSEIFRLGEVLRDCIETGGKLPFSEGGAEVQVVLGSEWIADLTQGYQDGARLLALASDNATIQRLRSTVRCIDHDQLREGEVVISKKTDNNFRNGDQLTIERIDGDIRVLENVPNCLDRFHTLSIDGFTITFVENDKVAFVPKDDRGLKALSNRVRKFHQEDELTREQAVRALDWVDQVNSFELTSVSTVHKSQGRSVDTVYIDTGTVLKRPRWLSPRDHLRLLYTAVTRARKRVSLL